MELNTKLETDHLKRKFFPFLSFYLEIAQRICVSQGTDLKVTKV